MFNDVNRKNVKEDLNKTFVESLRFKRNIFIVYGLNKTNKKLKRLKSNLTYNV